MTARLTDDRRQQLLRLIDCGLADGYRSDASTFLESLPGDAGFRRYFRWMSDPPVIAVDAPPEHEDCARFVRIDRLLRGLGVHAPEVLAVDYRRGLMLLEDLGEQQYQQALSRENRKQLDEAALETLHRIQLLREKPDWLEPYDAGRLRGELELFPHWFLGELLQRPPSAAERSDLTRLFEALEKSALGQPQALVHRDYHIRNLMLSLRPPGVVDFQDAVWGPVTYDLVSLLRDCYRRWPVEMLDATREAYRQRLAASIPDVDDAARFRRQFDWMGLQRHIKVLGIFARLCIRDGKRRYLDDLPLVIRYVVEVSGQYAELRSFHDWLLADVLPLAEQQPWYRDWQTAGDEDAMLFEP